MSKYECCYDIPRDFSVIRKRIAEKYGNWDGNTETESEIEAEFEAETETWD